MDTGCRRGQSDIRFALTNQLTQSYSGVVDDPLFSFALTHLSTSQLFAARRYPPFMVIIIHTIQPLRNLARQSVHATRVIRRRDKRRQTITAVALLYH